MAMDHNKHVAVTSQQSTPTLAAGARTSSHTHGQQAAGLQKLHGSYENSFSFGMNNTMPARLAANADSPCMPGNTSGNAYGGNAMYGSSSAVGGVCGSLGAWGMDHHQHIHQGDMFPLLRTRSSQGGDSAFEEWGSGQLPVNALESLSDFNTQMSLVSCKSVPTVCTTIGSRFEML